MRGLSLVALTLALPPLAATAQTALPPGPGASPATAPLPSSSLDPLGPAISAYQAGRHGEALRAAESLARMGNGRAATLAGVIRERGLAGTADFNAAADWYRRGAMAGEPDSLIGLARLGVANRGGVTPAQALGALQRAVSLGRTDAAGPLADMLVAGTAGPRDRARAASLYERAATAGDAEAAYAAAILYDDGDNDPVDDPLRANRLLKQAAEAGRADAAADYGLMLYQGRGSARDLSAAARWFRTAAEGGDKDGAFYWALVNARGEGTPRDLNAALRWAREARGSSADADRLLQQLEAAAARAATPAPKAGAGATAAPRS